jgi:hypothetical protein
MALQTILVIKAESRGLAAQCLTSYQIISIIHPYDRSPYLGPGLSYPIIPKG